MKATRVCSGLLSLALVASIGTGCSTVPVTGRHSFNLVPDSQANALGLEAYAKVKKESKLITSGSQYDQVLRVGKRIAAVADAPSFQWEFVLLDDPKTVNAFCLPGGKVASVQAKPSLAPPPKLERLLWNTPVGSTQPSAVQGLLSSVATAG